VLPVTETLLRRASFPVTLGIGIAVAVALAGAGAPDVVGLLVPIVGLALVVAMLERVIPWEPAWQSARGDVPTDVAHTAATVVLAPVVQGATVALLPVLAGGALASLPIALEVAIVIVLGDLGPYVHHRVSHEVSPLLFRIHAVHHAPTRLYWLNAFRVHPVNLAAGTALRLAPGVLLGASHEAVFVSGLVASMVNVWAHANVDVRAGILDWVFSGPALHRVHHHHRPEISQSNYGGTTIVWDVLFGTRRAPADVRDGQVGVGDATPPEGWLTQLLHPFGIRCCAGAR
jgi:sterol desaturase/sphingolipid hydroxylase (fatty acid hydroxylase superfamily)